MKRFYLLLAMLTTMVSGVQAEQVTSVRTTADDATTRYEYTFTCCQAGSNKGKMWQDSNGSLSTYSTSATKFIFQESGTAGAYYIKSVESGKFLTRESDNTNAAVSLSDNKQLWYVVVSTGTGNFANTVRISPDATSAVGINCADTGPKLYAAAQGANGNSWWIMDETSYNYDPSAEPEEPTELTMTFNRTSSSAATAMVKNQQNLVYPGIEGIVSCTKNYQTNTNVAHLTPSINCNTGGGTLFTFTFTISGVPETFTFDAIDLDIYAYNSAGGSQDTKTVRNVNLVLAENAESFASMTDADIAYNATKGEGNIIHDIHSLYSTYPATYKADGNGNVTVTLQVSKGTSNAGSFFGLKSVRLYTYDKRPVALEQLTFAIDHAIANSADCANHEEGTGLNQYVYSGTKAELDDAITVAQDFQSGITDKTTTQEIFDAVTALNSKLITFTMNMPAKGTYLRIYSTSANKYVAITDEGSPLMLTETADNSSVIYYDENGHFVNILNGLGVKDVNSASLTESEWNVFTFAPTETPNSYGKYSIKSDTGVYPFWSVGQTATTVGTSQFGNYSMNEFTLEFADEPVDPTPDEEKAATGASAWAGKVQDIAGVPTYVRETEAGKYSTIILPYNAKVTGATILQLAGKDIEDEKIVSLTFERLTESEEDEQLLVAGRPYLYRANDAVQYFTRTDEGDAQNVSPIEDIKGFTGVYSDKEITGEDTYMLYQQKFQNIGAGKFANIPALYCYITTLDDIKETEAGDNSRRITIGGFIDESTGLFTLDTESTSKDGKFVRNGRVVIVKSGKAYETNGTEVK